jgi:hypothetical protein
MSKNITIAPSKLPIASLSGGRLSLLRTAGALPGRRPLMFASLYCSPTRFSQAAWRELVMEVVLLESAKDLFFDIRGARTLVQSLDRRKADQAEGGV